MNDTCVQVQGERRNFPKSVAGALVPSPGFASGVRGELKIRGELVCGHVADYFSLRRTAVFLFRPFVPDASKHTPLLFLFHDFHANATF